MSLACVAADDAPAGGSSSSESGSESESETGETETGETETGTETETGEEDPCGACQPASDACQADEGASVGSFSFHAEYLSADIDGSFNYEDLCVLDSIESSDGVTLTASCGGQSPTVIHYSATPPAPAPNITPGTEVWITADVNGGGSGDGTAWSWWTIEIAETGEVVASFRYESGSVSDEATHGVCEGECWSGHMSERIGLPVSSGDESVLMFDGQHHAFSDSEVWLEAWQGTNCESGEQSQSEKILRIVPAP